MTLEQFHLMLGETLMHCQMIEHDTKLIYAGMKKGNMKENLDKIEKWTLGKTLGELKKLDNSDSKPSLSKDDYEFLSKMNNERIFLAHHIYRRFIYIENFLYSYEYNQQCKRLENFHDQLNYVSKNVEKARLKILKQFCRI